MEKSRETVPLNSTQQQLLSQPEINTAVQFKKNSSNIAIGLSNCQMAPGGGPCTVLCGFVLWCLDEEKLHPETAKAYLYGLSHIQKPHGFPPIPVAKSPTLPFILSRAKNKHVAKHPAKKRHP
jgi:hypothetical protein